MSTPSTPNLGNIIPSALARKIVYGVYAVGALAIGGIAIYEVTALGSVQSWLTGAQAVVAYLAIPVGTLGFVNAPTSAGTIGVDTGIPTPPAGE